MKEKVYSIKKNGRDNYLVLVPQEVPLYEMDLLNKKTLKGNLPMEIALQGGRTEFWYRLTGSVSVRTMLEMRKFGENELLEFMKSLYLFSLELEQNLLNPLGILIDFDTVFYKDEKTFLFCYNPTADKELKVDLLEMTEELLTLIDYKNQKMVKLLYHIYECLSQENPDYEKLQYPPEEEEELTFFEKELRKPEIINEYQEESPEETEKNRKDMLGFLGEAKDKAVKKGRETMASFKKKAIKKWGTYSDIKPVIIKAEESGENPTVLLGTEGMAKKGYCLKDRENEQEKIILINERIIIGKNHETADEVIEDESVSRRHAFITRQEGHYYLEDLNSLNGTFLNGERLGYKEKVCLRENDMIGIGGKTFCFCAL